MSNAKPMIRVCLRIICAIPNGNLVPVLTKAIQEQQAKINQQDEVINKLQNELILLKNELSSSHNFNKLMLDKFAELTDKLTILSEEKQNLSKSVN
jgi:predicted nuclease with TOPRIM domain